MIGIFLFALPTAFAISGVGAMFAEGRLTVNEFVKSIFVGSIDELKGLYGRDKTVISLEVDSLDLRHFQDLVTEARRQLMLTRKTKDWISGRMHVDGKVFPFKFRLRGDLPRHYSGKKISMRFQIKGENLWRGRKSFNLNVPQHSQYIVENFTSKVAEYFGLPNNKGDYVSLKVNGASLGSYVLLERYDKTVLERQGQAASTVFKIDETQFITFDHETQMRNYEYNFGENLIYDPAMWRNRTNEVALENEHRALLGKLFKLLTANPELSSDLYHQVKYLLDVEAYAWQSAFNFLFGAHLDAPHNAMIHFNAVTGQFEPLLVDPNFERMDFEHIDDSVSKFNFQFILNKLVTNREFIALRSEKLSQIVDHKPDIFVILRREFDESEKYYIPDPLLPARAIAGPKLTESMTGPIYQFMQHHFHATLNARFDLIEDYLKKSGNEASRPQTEDLIYKKPIVTSLVSYKDEYISVSFRHNQNEPLLLKDLSIIQQDAGLGAQKPQLFKDGVEIQSNVIDRSREDGNRLSWVYSGLNMLLMPNSENEMQIITANSPNLSEFNFVVADADSAELPENQVVKRIADPRQLHPIVNRDIGDVVELLESYNINVKQSGDVLTVLAGNYNISETIIIPKGIKLHFKAGTNFNFSANTWFVSYSPVNIAGEPGNPVIFQPMSHEEDWNGFLVMQTNQESTVRNMVNHLHVFGGNSGVYNGIAVTGAILFAESDVTIQNSVFFDSGLDDSVNVKRADLLIKNNVFLNARSDALDVDWGTGKVLQNFVYHSLGDGIDVSGSHGLEVVNNLIASSGDKALSVGEDSNIIADRNVLLNNHYGAVSKDLSKVALTNNIIALNKIAMAAYQKKSFFGGGTLYSSANAFGLNDEHTFVDENSMIETDGKSALENSIVDLESLDNDEPLTLLNALIQNAQVTATGISMETWKKLLAPN